MPRVPLVITVMAVLARVASAAPCEDARALRDDLEHESARVDHWVLAWRIAYTAIAAGEFAGAASGAADHDTTQSLWVGGAKSTLGALGFWFSPLRVRVPPPTGEACSDKAALREAAERAAFDERQSFWVAHVGGLIVNAAGMLVLAETASWRTGLLSFATGYPVGLLSTYTMPRASWGRTREAAWTANVVVTGERYALVVRGSF